MLQTLIQLLHRITQNFKEAYIKNLAKWFKPDFLKGLKIVIDLAYGATKEISPHVLKLFGADVISMNEGEGLINDSVGSRIH